MSKINKLFFQFKLIIFRNIKKIHAYVLCELEKKEKEIILFSLNNI